MINYSNVIYTNNALRQVICRFDFAEMLGDILNNPEIIGTIRKYFPQKAAEEVINQLNFQVEQNPNEPAKFSGGKSAFTQLKFISNDGLNTFIISSQYIVFDYTAYTNFEELSACIGQILNSVVQCYRNFTIGRMGLRYINIFDNNTIKPQQSYFSSTIEKMVKTTNIDEIMLSRALYTVEYFRDDIRINTRIGKYNPNYPGMMSSNDFVIDIDAYIEGAYRFADIYPNKLTLSHDSIQEVFEHYITDKLRAVMNG